jgi:hypothetical protein
MNRAGVFGVSCAALLALASSASAGPMSVAPSDLIEPPQPKVEMAAYRHYYHPHYVYHRHYYHRHYTYRHPYYYRHGRYYAVNPGAVVAGAGLGALSLGVGAATLGACGIYGCGYGWPYYYRSYYYPYPDYYY